MENFLKKLCVKVNRKKGKRQKINLVFHDNPFSEIVCNKNGEILGFTDDKKKLLNEIILNSMIAKI